MAVKTVSGKWNLTSKTQAIGARFPLPMVEQIEEVAAREGITMSSLLVSAVQEKLERAMSSGEGNSAAVVG